MDHDSRLDEPDFRGAGFDGATNPASGEPEDEFAPIKHFFQATEWEEMSAYDKKSFLSRYENYNNMKEAGYPATLPDFMTRGQTPNVPPKKKKNGGDEDWSPETRVKMKASNSRANYFCDVCSSAFSSKRLFDNHRKSCKTLVEGIEDQPSQASLPIQVEGSEPFGQIGNQSASQSASSISQHEFLNETRASFSTPRLSLLRRSEPSGSSTQIPFKSRILSSWREESLFSAGRSASQSSASFSHHESLNVTRVSGSFSPVGSHREFPANDTGSFSLFSLPTSSQDPSQENRTTNEMSSNQRTGNENMTRSEERRPLAPIQIAERPASQSAASFSHHESLSVTRVSGSYSPVGSHREFPANDTGSFSLFSLPTSSQDPSQENRTTNEMPSNQRTGNENMTRSEERRPLAPIQIRETRFRVPAVSSEGVLPSPQDPNFVFALNTESRVNRLMADAVSTMKYKYDVKSILQRAIGGSKALESLNNSQFIYGAQRNVIVQALVDYLFQSVSHKAQVSTIMRECMAIQLVATWPALKMHLYSKEDRPWHYWYNADQNTGYLENATQVKQRTSKRSGASGIRKSRNTTGAKKPRKLTLAAVQDNHDDSDPEEYIRDVTEARELVGHPHQRSVVLQLMIQTHERRRTKIVLKQVDTFKILNEFPQFMHFHGDVIEQEFNLIYEQKQSCFVREFVYDMVPKLLKIAESDPKTFENCTPSQYDVINAIVVLAKMLPTPVRSFEHERTMPLQASLSDFFNVIPVSSDPNQYVTQRQAESEYKVQPHILATGNQQGVRKMWLVVDSKLMELHRNATPVTAIDLLIKSFFVFHLHFPLAWKNVLRFLQVHIFQIPLENERWSKFSEVHLRLKHFRV